MNVGYRYLAAAGSGLGLAIPFLYPQAYLLTWCALLPVLWAVQGQSLMRVYTLGLTMGFVMYGVAANCIVDFIGLYNGLGVVGGGLASLLFWGYCGQLFALALVLTRWLEMQLRMPWLLLLPVCLTFFLSRFPMMFPVQLAESQSSFTTALQALDLVGTAGLDFIIVLVNVGLFELGYRRSPVVSWQGLAVLPVMLWFGYGLVMAPAWEQRTSHWPRLDIGVVQSDEPPSAEVPAPRPGYSRGYPPEMALSEQLVQHDVDLLVWPETRYKGYFAYPWVRDTFRRLLGQMQVPLVFQDTEYASDRSGSASDTGTYNTAVMLDLEGELHSRYRKIKRMPMAEYIPGLNLWPELKARFYQHFSDFFTDFLPGESFVRFRINDTEIVPLICFEVMLSDYVAQAVRDSQGVGSGRLLLVQSNSSWFGDSRQSYQQLNAAVLRSVENRLPMVYVSNRGPSGLILPSGQRVYQSPFLQQLGVVLRVPYQAESSGTFFNRHPSLLLDGLSWVLFGLVLLVSWRYLGGRAFSRSS